MVLRPDSIRQRLLKLEETVSGYLRIDQNRIDGALERAPGDFRDVAQAIRRWIGANLVSTP